MLIGADIDFQIVPFRGEYYSVASAKRNIVQHMIYPVADPALPFLGVHLTPTMDGSLIAGPTAVPTLARAHYQRFRPAERRVGQGLVRSSRSRWSPYH